MRALSLVISVAALLLALALVVPGWQRYAIVSGSMRGTYDRGSLVFDEVVPVGRLRVGDVITYRPPPGAHITGLVTHRIVWSGHDPHGAPSFRTKGDFNESADSWQFTLRAPTQAKVVAHIPLIGYVLAALGDRKLRMFVIGIPALVIGIAVAIRLWRDPEGEPAPPVAAAEESAA